MSAQELPVERGRNSLDRGGDRAGRRRRYNIDLQVMGVYVALGSLWLALSFASPYFFTRGNITNLLIAASTLSLIGAGLTLVLIVGEIDLSIAAMQALVGSVSAVLIVNHGVPWLLAVFIALGIGLGAGVMSGLISVIGRLPTFITTLAMMGILSGSAYLVTNNQPVVGIPASLELAGAGRVGDVPVSIIIVAAVYLVLQFMLRQTEFGLNMFAVGGNRSAAIQAGIRWQWVVVGVLGLSGLLAGCAGIIITARLGAGSGEYGSQDLLPAVAGVIIGGASLTGGKGSLFGTFGGVMMVVTIYNGLTLLNVSEFWQDVVVGLIIMGAVLIDNAAKRSLAKHLPGF